MKFDLEWGDEDVLPERVYPDTDFVFTKMGQVSLSMVAPQKGEKILDIGCGRAIDALKLARESGSVIGLDPSGKMVARAKEHIGDGQVNLVRGIGEALPFKRHSLDKIMCKGSLDHFADPLKTIEEMSQVLKPKGKTVIAIANFESLSCRLGKATHPIMIKLNKRKKDERPPWQPPPDHTYRFDYPLLRGLVEQHFDVEKAVGISLLWAAPYWGKTLSILPRWVSGFILAFLDRVARPFPSLSDVIVIRLVPKNY